MILFFNVFVTTKAFTIYDRGELGPSQDRFDVFKYTLASYQPLTWEHVVIYAELDEMYAHRKAELEDYIYSLYPNASFYPFRNKHQREWKTAVDALSALSSDGLVWFLCNDDHIFVDYETALVERLHAAAKNELTKHPHVAIFPFSWAERICYSDPDYIGHEEPKPYPILERSDDYFKISWGHNDSAQVVSLEVLRKWWFDFDYGDAFKPRTDTGPSPVPGVTDIHAIMPWREIALHYDGSSNVGIDPNAYPAHRIPEGFFENRIRIQFGGAERIPGYVWFNPDIEVHASVSPEGVDYRRLIDDIPLFWRNRISEIRVCDERSDEFWIRRRNDAILRTASQFWRSDKASLIQALRPVFRRLNECIPLSTQSEALNRHVHVTTYKEMKESSDFAFIILERNVQQATFQTVHSISSATPSKISSQIIWVGTESSIDRAMFERVSRHIVFNDNNCRELGTYNKHAAWNSGAFGVRAKYFIFSDGLNIFPSDFLSRAETQMGSCDALVVGSRYLTFGPYSDGGAREPSALVVRADKFLGFSEHVSYLGEFGGLDRCAAQLAAEGLSVKICSDRLFCWRVPSPRSSVLDGFRSDTGAVNFYERRASCCEIFLEGISRQVLRGEFHQALCRANKLCQFPGMKMVREVLSQSGDPAAAVEMAYQLANEFSSSGQHISFAAVVAFKAGDHKVGLELSLRALALSPILITPQIIRLCTEFGDRHEAAKQECIRLIRMYPLEESLWGMIGL